MTKVNKAGVKLIERLNKIGKNRQAICLCPKCNKQFTMWLSHFYRGSNSCKCNQKTNERLYRIYTNMKTRCYNTNSPSYKLYGLRGISICDEWFYNYKSFEKWAISHGYSDSLTIDRIDCNGDYSPNNCRWVDTKTQARNKRNNVIVDGVCLKDWCKLNNLSYKSVTSYIYRHGVIKTK